MREERFGKWENVSFRFFGSKSHSREIEDVDVAAETETVRENRREEKRGTIIINKLMFTRSFLCHSLLGLKEASFFFFFFFLGLIYIVLLSRRVGHGRDQRDVSVSLFGKQTYAFLVLVS